LRTLDFYARGIRVALRIRPDLIQCNDYNTMWVGAVARLVSPRTALVYDSHEIWAARNLRPEPRWWLLGWEFMFVRIAHAVVMTSPAHADVLCHRYRIAPPTVVRNIPARSESSASRGNGEHARRRGDVPVAAAVQPVRGAAPADGRVAVYVGVLLRHRGLEQSIRAIARLETVTLRLLGPVADDYRGELEGLARSVGVADRVEFAPPVPPTEVVDNLARADVGLALFQPTCLSHRLVLPNKLFEYVHAGLPIVGSDLPMIRRFIDEHGVGTVVDAEDPEAVARGLEEVLSPERHERLREAARGAGGELDWERESEVLAGVYRRALARAQA
ncbi:MAG TPA: glycosyltransferase family 4 protein, partial [Solirubrobacteraceae bacterium]|nr:glycosyltransferase family 4 protein [Solirubrobacteraceae bacterium]